MKDDRDVLDGRESVKLFPGAILGPLSTTMTSLFTGEARIARGKFVQVRFFVVHGHDYRHTYMQDSSRSRGERFLSNSK